MDFGTESQNFQNLHLRPILTLCQFGRYVRIANTIPHYADRDELREVLLT